MDSYTGRKTPHSSAPAGARPPQRFAVARFSSTFVEGEIVYVRLVIEDACLDMLGCGFGDTCHAGLCYPDAVHAASFGRSTTQRASAQVKARRTMR